LEQAIVALAQQEEQRPTTDEAESSGVMLYAAAVGTVGAAGASTLTDPVSAALFGACAALVPPALAFAIGHSKEGLQALAEARDWLEERRHERFQAQQAAEHAARVAELAAREQQQRAAAEKWRLVERIQANSMRYEAACKRGQMPEPVLTSAFEQRRLWQKLLVSTYEAHSERNPKRWQGGQPFGKARLQDQFGKDRGLQIYSKLVKLGVVLPNQRQPQWNYELVGHTQELALDWLEGQGLVDDD
jgi:hypothetical protein